MATPAEIQRLMDRIALAEQVTRVTRCIDTKRFDDMVVLYTPDAVLETPAGSVHGPEAIADVARRNHESYEQTQHLVTGTTVDFADTDTARVVADVVSVFVPRVDEPGSTTMLGVRYEFGSVRDGSGWRFATHAIAPVWQRA